MSNPKRERDLASLHKERKASDYPFSLSPYASGQDGLAPGDEPEEELKIGEVRVKAPEEVPWIDLLLEIAMTTAFASLTDGTPILQWDNALSYVLYFIFVWWIWVSQVAYNMRFRQADWLHRIWVFAQLIVFSALAAFTKDFDITSGLSDNRDEAEELVRLQSELGKDQSQLDASKFRAQRLPQLNAKGVSIVMAISRVLLLLQYVVIFYHARGRKRTSLLAHIVPLFFSALCYLGAFFVLLRGPSDDDNSPSRVISTIKLALWYFPILVEIATHFLALRLPGFVRYSTEALYARSGTVFLIILGAGLDKITTGFQAIVGNAGLGSDGIPTFVAAAVIFIGYFSLYFATPGSSRELGNRRGLAWFFAQFFFLSALIVTLQGIATSLQFTNLIGAISKSNDAIQPMYDWIENHPGVNLTATDFPAAKGRFDKLGLALDDYTESLNTFIAFAVEENNHDIVISGEQLIDVFLAYNLLTNLGLAPDPQSLLAAKLDVFLLSDGSNTTDIKNNFLDIKDHIVRDRGSSALWFYPAAGSTILALVLMSWIQGKPRDKWEWGIIISRSITGLVVILLGFLDLGASKPVFDSDDNVTDCPIWRIALSEEHFLLIIMAVAMGALQIVERIIAYLANRSYYSFENIDFLNGPERRRTKRLAKLAQKYEATGTDDTIPLTPYSYSDQPGPDPGYTEYSYKGPAVFTTG